MIVLIIMVDCTLYSFFPVPENKVLLMREREKKEGHTSYLLKIG